MHKSQKHLISELRLAEKKVKVGGIYYHYKNPQLVYKVLMLAITEADDSICVVYEAQYGNKLTFVRPVANWLDKVKWESKEINRFTLVEQNKH